MLQQYHPCLAWPQSCLPWAVPWARTAPGRLRGQPPSNAPLLPARMDAQPAYPSTTGSWHYWSGGVPAPQCSIVTLDLKRWVRWCCHLQSPESCQGMFLVPLGSSCPTAAMVVVIAPLTRAPPKSQLQLPGHRVKQAPVLPLSSALKSVRVMVCQGARLSSSGKEKDRLHGSEI